MEKVMGNLSIGFSSAQVTAEVREDDISMEQNQEVIDQGKPDKDGDEKLVKIFGNHLLVDRITSYLDHSSIMFLGQTCHMLLRIVRGNRNFLNRTGISLVRREEGPPVLDPKSLQLSNFPWKHCTFEVNSWTSEECQAILSILDQVESLTLHNSVGPTDVLVNDLVGFLNAARNITELAIGGSLLTYLDKDVLAGLINTSEMVKYNLEKLKSLRISDGMARSEPTFLDRSGCKFENFGPSLTEIAQFPLALTSFTLKGVWITMNLAQDNHIGKAVDLILERHKTTLRYLSLETYIWYQKGNSEVEGIPHEDIVFPALKKLSLRARDLDFTKVATFLAKQPPLESLSLSFDGFMGISDPHALLTPLLSHGPTLKKFSLVWTLSENLPRFHLVVMHLPNPNDLGPENEGPPNALPAPVLLPIPPPELDFSFLQNFESLRGLKIIQKSGFADSRSPSTILSVLPDGVRRIKLLGGTSASGVNDHPQSTVESLGRFRNLTTLHLIHCSSVLDDEILAFICSNMPQLREFGFSHCRGVTDSGLTGNKDGVSIGPGIRALTDIGCPRLTTAGFIESISFRDLKSLTLVPEQEDVPPSFYVGIALQNRGLEVLETSPCRWSDSMIHSLRVALKQQSPRFRKLKLPCLIPPRHLRHLVGDLTDSYYGSIKFMDWMWT